MNIIDYIKYERINKIDNDAENQIKELKYKNSTIKKYIELEKNFNEAMDELFNSQNIENQVLKINKYEPHMKYVIAKDFNNEEVEAINKNRLELIDKEEKNANVANMMLEYAETKEQVEDVLMTYGYIDKKTKQPII